MIDIIGSFVVRAAVVLIILTTMANLSTSLYRQSERASLEVLVTGAGETIYNDLALAGYRSSSKLFLNADSLQARFYSDLNDDGVVETVRYYLGPGSSGTHRILYRTLNAGTPFEIARDVILLNFTFYSTTGSSLTGTNVAGVKSVRIFLTIESNNKLRNIYSGTSDTLTYQKATWQGYVFPSNM
ncbi:MAG: hypothetical protein ACOYNS_06285 [Bacteroidota bacterium]